MNIPVAVVDSLTLELYIYCTFFLVDPQPIPEYKATPIASAAPKLLTLEFPKSKSKDQSNKRKLQYNPENPAIDSVCKIKKNEASENPTYIPSPRNAPSKEETIYEDIINCKDLKFKSETIAKSLEVIKTEPITLSENNGHLEREHSSTSSTSTSSRHKSSKRKHSSSRRENEKNGEPSSKKKSRSDDESTSTTKKSSSRDKERKSDSSSRSKPHSKDKETSSSSRSHRDKKSRKDKDRASFSKDEDLKSKHKDPIASLDVPSISYQSCGEDDVDEECRRIFEELKNTTKAKPKLIEEEPKVELKEYDDLSKKKRVAHEGLVSKPPPPIVKRPNHTQTAMQAVYKREEVGRNKAAKETEEAAENLRIAQENLKKAAEDYKKSQEKHLKLTPLIPKSYLTPPSRPHAKSIAPVSTAITFFNAKKKVDELIAMKKGFISSNSQTLATTATKGASRVAHVSNATSGNSDAVAPPPLESGSSKISLHLRMQYYNLMVKHCLTIYTSKEDAWQRAQNDELNVFNKCKSPIIYKSSALLAINKLKKEAEHSGNLSLQPKMVSHEVILGGKQAQQCSWSVSKKM